MVGAVTASKVGRRSLRAVGSVKSGSRCATTALWTISHLAGVVALVAVRWFVFERDVLKGIGRRREFFRAF